MNVGDRVIFHDRPHGTCLSMNGRKGTVVYPNVLPGYIGVEWDEKLHDNDDGFSYVVPDCLRLEVNE